MLAHFDFLQEKTKDENYDEHNGSIDLSRVDNDVELELQEDEAVEEEENRQLASENHDGQRLAGETVRGGAIWQ